MSGSASCWSQIGIGIGKSPAWITKPSQWPASTRPALEPCCVRPRAYGLRNLRLLFWKSPQPVLSARHFFQGKQTNKQKNRMKAEARSLSALLTSTGHHSTSPEAPSKITPSVLETRTGRPGMLGAPVDALPPKLGASVCQGCLLLRVRTSRQHTCT